MHTPFNMTEIHFKIKMMQKIFRIIPTKPSYVE